MRLEMTATTRKPASRAANPATLPRTARAAALRLLQNVLIDARMLSDAEGALERLSPADRARAQRLASETLRHLGRADHVLAAFLSKPPPAPVLVALRLAVVEICTGGDAHGIVNETVALVAGLKTGGTYKGLANAVLRRVATEGAAMWDSAPPAYLPDWLRGRLVAAWGGAAVRGIEASLALPPPVDLTARGDATALAAAVGGRVLPTGSVRIDAGAQVSALPGYAEGAFWVQDAAAALPARLLAPAPGAQVLDLCAAPGGKTMQLAAMGADVTAVDLSGPRMRRVQENLTRTGLTANLVVADALLYQGRYDAVLLDAPCSATGTLRRHPDLPHVRQAAALEDLTALQARLIDHALTLLAPGGRMVFCTCSLLPDEGEAQVAAALGRHPGLRVLPVDVAGVESRWLSPVGGLRLRPDHWADRGGIDGFYMVALQKD
jgi:16S rRNA (cytosine967-C5)-methyltransferase